MEHDRPNGTRCVYLAERFCEKCGWVDPRLISWRPHPLAAFATGVLFGIAAGVMLALALVP